MHFFQGTKDKQKAFYSHTRRLTCILSKRDKFQYKWKLFETVYTSVATKLSDTSIFIGHGQGRGGVFGSFTYCSFSQSVTQLVLRASVVAHSSCGNFHETTEEDYSQKVKYPFKSATLGFNSVNRGS